MHSISKGAAGLDALRGIVVAAHHKLCYDGELLGSQTECFLGDVEGYAFYLDEDTSGSYRCHEAFGITFTFTHTYLGRLLGDGLVGEYTDPDLALTLHIAGYSDTGGLYLTAGDPFRFQRLYAKRAEGELVAALGLTFHPALLRATEFRLFRL